MTPDSSPPDVSASVSQVSERAASDHDCTRCSRCTAPPKQATHRAVNLAAQPFSRIVRAARTDCAAAQHLRDLPKKRYLGKFKKHLRISELQGKMIPQTRLRFARRDENAHEFTNEKKYCNATDRCGGMAGIAAPGGRERACALHTSLIIRRSCSSCNMCTDL